MHARVGYAEKGIRRKTGGDPKPRGRTNIEGRSCPALKTRCQRKRNLRSELSGLWWSHLGKDANVGQIISNYLDALQIHARTSWPVLSQDRTQVHRYVCGTNQTTVSNGTNCTWATKLWEFNDPNEYTICHGNQPWLRNQGDGNSFIMEKVINLPGITDTDLKAVQRCRLYLKATTTSDLANSAGTALAKWVIKPDRYPNNAPLSYLQYPNQGKPTSPT
jgi:hypothetical protein